MPHQQDLEKFASLSEPQKRYTKFHCIGRGASKVVYKGFDEVEGIEVAWNEVSCSDWVLGSAKERQHVMGEIQMLRQLKHRNVMRLYDWWYDRQGQVLVFITELLTDGSLRRFIRRKHAAGITLSALKRYAWQILQGLVYLHGHYPPIIHRDLKCDNVFVNGAAGELKIGDLGFATLLKGMSAPLSVIGTPEFMAPELYDERYDEKVDIYSFGMCLLEMATQEYPYAECTNPAQIFRKVTNGVPPAAVQKVSFPALKDFILLTIQPDPAKRPEARQLLVHPFFEDVRQQIRSKGCLRMPPAAANAAAAAAVALAAAGMPAGEALALDAAVVVGAGAAAGCLPAAHTPQSVLTGLRQLALDEAAAEARMASSVDDSIVTRSVSATAAPGYPTQQQQQQHGMTWGPAHSHQMATAAAVMAAMAAAAPPQQLLGAGDSSSTYSSALSTPMHSIGLEASTSSLASNSSWGSLQQQYQQQYQQAVQARRKSNERRRSQEGLRRSTDEMSEEDVLFDAQAAADAYGDADTGPNRKARRSPKQQQQQQQQPVPEGASGEGSEDAAEGTESGEADASDGQGLYLSPINEDEDEEEGVDCECRRIDQEQLSFNVGFFNAKGMKKRVGFQFNALEDTVESIGLEMVEQLALNAHQVRCIADKIRAALEALGLGSNGSIAAAPAGAVDALSAGHEPIIGQTGAFAIVATAAATAAIEEAAAPDAVADAGAPGGSLTLPSSPFAMADAAGGGDGEGHSFSAFEGGSGPSGSRAGSVGGAGPGSLPVSRASSLGVSHSPGLMGLQGSSSGGGGGGGGGHFLGGTSPTSSLGLLGVSPGSVAAVGAGGGDASGADVRMCPQQLVRQLSMLGRNAATALLANLQEDLLQQSYASPEAAAAIGIDAGDNGSVHGGVALVKSAAPLPPLPEHAAVRDAQELQQPAASLPDAVKVPAGGDKQA